MLFTEPVFFVFFVLVFATHWLTPSNRARKVLLLVASYVFYGAWDWRFLSLIAISTLVDYFVGLRLARVSTNGARRALLVTSLAVNLCILGFFKYFNFFATSIGGLLATAGLSIEQRTLEIVLPVGISFYTFQTLSYTIDVYRRKIDPHRDLVDFSLFVAFFPQLVAGPIVRAKEFLPQLSTRRRFSDIDFRPLVLLFLAGFVKKACIADNIAPFVDSVFAAPGDYSAPSIWLAVLYYAVQIYCDFSGYTDMAIAVAGFLGYELEKNFEFPYFADNISEFWRRWHISLSTWLKDYLYIPLGGSRASVFFTYRNLMLTMLLGGLWHGAAWNFVIWGGLHGISLIVHKHVSQYGREPALLGCLSAPVARLVTFYWVCVGWIFFRAAGFADAMTMLKAFVTLQSPGTESVPMAYWYGFVLLGLVHWVSYRRFFAKGFQMLPDWAVATAYGMAVMAILPFVQMQYKPFIYFQF